MTVKQHQHAVCCRNYESRTGGPWTYSSGSLAGHLGRDSASYCHSHCRRYDFGCAANTHRVARNVPPSATHTHASRHRCVAA